MSLNQKGLQALLQSYCLWRWQPLWLAKFLRRTPSNDGFMLQQITFFVYTILTKTKFSYFEFLTLTYILEIMFFTEILVCLLNSRFGKTNFSDYHFIFGKIELHIRWSAFSYFLTNIILIKLKFIQIFVLKIQNSYRYIKCCLTFHLIHFINRLSSIHHLIQYFITTDLEI